MDGGWKEQKTINSPKTEAYLPIRGQKLGHRCDKETRRNVVMVRWM